MLRFLTIFPYAKNIHLIKDVGMLPFILHEQLGYNATLASYNNGSYPYLESEVNGLKQVFIPKIFRISTLDIFLFLLFNFRKYDIAQCYHFEKQSLLILSFFKFLKWITFSSGFTFLKLDAVDRIKEKKISRLSILLSKKINLVSVETIKIFDYLNSTNLLGRNVEYIPNGFYSKDERKVVNFDLKENIIITVGRIGIFEKNNEVLLESFQEFSLINDDWKLEVIGPIEPSFDVYIKKYFDLYPNLRSRIHFTGAISDRAVLQSKYEKAKIFVLTSIEEGFPLVFLEAVRSGCTIISSRLTSAYDITDNEKYGALFSIGDSKELTEKFVNVISDSNKLKKDCLSIQQFAYEKYSWNNIAVLINNLIQK